MEHVERERDAILLRTTRNSATCSLNRPRGAYLSHRSGSCPLHREGPPSECLVEAKEAKVLVLRFVSDADLAGTRDGRRRTHRLTERSGELACTQFRRFPLILCLFQSILQNLPAEILALIFEDPVTSDVTATLARAIRPFTRANRYRKLDITYSKFIKLCELIQGSLEIAGLVVELRLSDCYRYRVREEIPLFDFFRSATSLKILEIENSTDFPARLLSAKFIFACYSSLTHLKFLSYSNSAATLSYQFRNLCFIPRLEYLSIAWECDAEEAKYDEVEGVALQWEEESLTLHTAGIFSKRARLSVFFVLTLRHHSTPGVEAQGIESASATTRFGWSRQIRRSIPGIGGALAAGRRRGRRSGTGTRSRHSQSSSTPDRRSRRFRARRRSWSTIDRTPSRE